MGKRHNLSRWNRLVKEYGYHTVSKYHMSIIGSWGNGRTMKELEKVLKEKERDITYFLRKANGWPKSRV